MIALGTEVAIGVVVPMTTARVRVPVLPDVSVATAWSKRVPGVTGTIASHVPSAASTAGTSFTVTEATAVSSVAVPFTSIIATSPANVPKSGDVISIFGAFGSTAGPSGSNA